MTIIYLQLIALWLFVPALVFASAVFRVRRLRRHREHDLILYAFCDARDTIAVKAARGEIDERSMTFQYFYKGLSNVIHEHKSHPIGFAHLARSLSENKNRPAPTWVLRLLRELKKSDEETKQMVRRYIHGIELVMKQDTVVALFDMLPFWVRKHQRLFRSLANKPFVPRRQRSFLRFNLKLADVVGYQPRDFCPLPV
jgi:hypothetical protein